jgi:hypothetical protein
MFRGDRCENESGYGPILEMKVLEIRALTNQVRYLNPHLFYADSDRHLQKTNFNQDLEARNA